MKHPTPAMIRALKVAAERPRGAVCPIPGVHAAAETKLLDAMERRGLIQYDGPIPYITRAGWNAVEFLYMPCTRCGVPIRPGAEVWLEGNFRDGCYHKPGEVAPEDSQGAFPFGKKCAQLVLGR